MTARDSPGPSQAADRADSLPAASDIRAVSSVVEHELAVLRQLWGGRYRITWQGGYRATHIISGEAVASPTSTELRKLIMITESGVTHGPGNCE